ncbi:class I SAM-dependent methyltransferase [Mycoplasmopsis iners]|uniref:class I SAM-dependent methyltransferase n=1 Tax=Mycoplasmopsis iners TaxID=76630 RepID=UPI000496CADB|nr:class I SAM-dependent methyltransferase [Mycoplasmopsis iners]
MKSTKKYTSVYETDSSLVHYTNAIFEVGLLDAEKQILKKLKLPINAMVADLGSGPGRFGISLYEIQPNYQIDCYDLSSKSIEIGNKLAKELKLKKLNFIEADLTETNVLPIDKYNLCFFTFNSLMTIPEHNNKKLALLNAYNALKNGGYLVFSAPTISGDPAREDFIKNNLSKEHERKADITYKVGNQLGVLCHYEKAEILALLKEINIPSPIFAAKRDDFANETQAAKKFSDNALYYVIQKA